LEAEGPMLKLGGTWQFPQQADSISLSSHSSDEGTNFTDTDSTSALSGSAISSPLQVCHVCHLSLFISSYQRFSVIYETACSWTWFYVKHKSVSTGKFPWSWLYEI